VHFNFFSCLMIRRRMVKRKKEEKIVRKGKNNYKNTILMLEAYVKI